MSAALSGSLRTEGKGRLRWLLTWCVAAWTATAGKKGAYTPLRRRGPRAWENYELLPARGLWGLGTTRHLAHAIAESSSKLYFPPHPTSPDALGQWEMQLRPTRTSTSP